MDQVVAVFALPVTVAVNCMLWVALRLAVEGPTPTLTVDPPPPLPPPPLGGGTGREMVPEPPVAGIEVPDAVEATTPVICTGIEVFEGFEEI